MAITVDLGSAGVGYTENEGDLTLFAAATFVSSDDSFVDIIEITLNNALPVEALSVSSLPAGYISSYDSVTGVLTISSGTGDISDANWESALRSVQYNNSSDNPPGAREITVIASDTVGPATSASTLANYTIAITSSNDAPVITGDLAAAITEAGNYVITVADLEEADPDDGGVELTYTVTSQTNGTVKLEGLDVLTFTAQDVIDGKVSFTHDSSETLNAGFEFSLADGGEDAVLPETGTFSFAVTPVNDPPSGAVTIDGTAQENATLTANTSTIGDNDGLGTFSYQWLRDNVAISGATGETYGLSATDIGKQISVTVSYTDGQGTPESLTSDATAIVTNVNDPPSGAVTIDGQAQENATLTANTSTIVDNDELGAFSYQWLRDNVAISGATGETYVLNAADIGKQITVTVSYTDGQGTPESLTSNATAIVTNVNDPPTGAVTIDGQVQENATLTANTSTIADNDELGTFSYQWLRDNVAISGATGETYVLSATDIGKQITVTVSYTDGQGTPESLTSDATAIVTNVNDPPSGAVTIDGQAQENATLTANTSTIADNDGLGTFSYQWLRDNVAISGATGETYALSATDIGKQISVTVSYTDGQGTPESLTSDATAIVTNVNDPPTGAVTIDGTAQENATLTANTSTIGDNDGLGTFSYQWLRDNVAISGATGETYVLNAADIGKQITVTVSYTDGQGTPESLTSDATAIVTNVNDPPTGAVTIDGQAQENATLTANTSTIADNDELGAFSYQWLRDNVAISGATGETYVLNAADIGKQITVTVSYTDGQGTPESLTSDPTAIVAGENQAPMLLAPLADQAVQYDTVNWSYNTSASFSDEDSLTYSATLVGGAALPAWIQINATTGIITGTPNFSNYGIYALEITATDTHGLFIADTLTLAVTAFDAGQLLVNTSANDVFAGTGANDTVTYAYAAAPITVSLALTGSQNTGGAGSDILNNINNLIGSNYSDNLTGDSQNNVLDGGIGTDTLVGGLGNDSYIVNLTGDIVTEKFNAGIDTVKSSVTYALPGQVENLTLMGTANINGNGNALANVIIGNVANNTLNGGVGADTAMGGLGNDIYFVDNTNDIVNENLNEGIDKISSSVTYTLPDNVEDLTLTATAAINGIGNDLVNILLGNSAANVLNGGIGADTLRGGTGDDTYVVDNVGDIVTENLNAGIDTVNSNITYTLKSNIEHLILSGTAAINGTGNVLANTITGNAAANLLNGATGADTLIGGLGDDIYTIDNAGDIIVENLNEGIDRVNSSVSYMLSDNVENITLIGSSAINATGNGIANTIVGNSASNQLIGGAGDDILNGAAGNNTLTGGTGKDYFQFKTADHITGGRIDTITDYNAFDDTIKLENSIFTAFSAMITPDKIPADQFVIGTQALDANDFIIYNNATGAVLYDADGNGAGAAVQFATLSTGLALTNWDFHAI